jgi:hypothetical protein
MHTKFDIYVFIWNKVINLKKKKKYIKICDKVSDKNNKYVGKLGSLTCLIALAIDPVTILPVVREITHIKTYNFKI